MSKTKKIWWKNRLIGDTGNDALVTVDGTDFRIQEPIPFNRRWYSKKFNGPALRYEVGISINTGYIVWFNGPLVCLKYFVQGQQKTISTEMKC